MNSSRLQKLVVIQTEKKKLTDVIEIFRNAGIEANVFPHPPSLDEIRTIDPDLLILDYCVQDMSGILFYKKIAEDPDLYLIPAIFISDSKSYQHRLNAFEMGATDFINRPFAADDLVRKAHMHVQNRKRFNEDKSVEIGNLRLDPQLGKVLVNNQPVSLTQLEYKILHYLLTKPKQVITRTEIYEDIWGKSMTSTGRLDTQLYNLKKKLHEFSGKIKSVNKIGMRVLIEDTTFYPEQKTLEPLSPLQ